jgi:hypothetical protein
MHGMASACRMQPKLISIASGVAVVNYDEIALAEPRR